MNTDRVTKLLLAAIAVGLFANAPQAWLNPAHAAQPKASISTRVDAAQVGSGGDAIVTARPGETVFFVHDGKLYQGGSGLQGAPIAVHVWKLSTDL